MPATKHLLEYVQAFFQDYLAAQRGMSANTIMAYRDALKLLLSFVCRRLSKSATKLELQSLQADIVLAFLDDLEKNRHNGLITRNHRLAALRTFFRYLVAEDPLHAGQYQRIVAIPLKRQPQSELVYLDVREFRAVLDAIDRNQAAGRRDFTLLSFLYNTGARVQEVCDLRVKDVRLVAPPLASLTGKGNKTRSVPLWPETAALLLAYIGERAVKDNPDAWFFVNARGNQLSRFGIRHILRTRVESAASRCPSLQGKPISPHTIRHTTAMHLLQSGVDLAVIKSWLGHVNFATTQAYVEIDMEMKRKALSSCQPAESAKKLDRVLDQRRDVIKWLSSL